jgi:hypothetical protein
VGAYFYVSQRRLNLWHVARDTLASRTSGFVMSVFFDCGSAGSVRRQRTVAIQTDFVGRLSQFGILIRPVRIMATKASDPTSVHDTLYEIVPLHPVFVRSTIGKMSEAKLT